MPDRRLATQADRAAEAAVRAIPAVRGADPGLRWVGRSWGFTLVVLACVTVTGGRRSARATVTGGRDVGGEGERKCKRKESLLFFFFNNNNENK